MARRWRVLGGLLMAGGLLAWVLLAASVTQAAEWKQKVDPWVLETAVSGDTEFILYLNEQADLSGAAQFSNKEAKGRYVYEQLTAVARRAQPALIAQLDSLGVPYRQYWIANMIWVRGDERVLEALAKRQEVTAVYANPTAPTDLPSTESEIRAPTNVESNLTLVNADDVWGMGYTGQGVVVGGQDTGYSWTHSGLKNQYRGWDGSTASHDYNWHDAIHSGGGVCGADSPYPCDDHYHGTHTMGIMLGNDLDPTSTSWPAGANNAVGMAPGAEWIGCRNMDVGVGTPATYAECYEWFIAPYPVGGDPLTDGDPTQAPDVINNSWGCPTSEGCTDPEVLLSVVQAVRAAGIVTVHSAGNEGPSCSSIQTPAAIYDESFTVANTMSNDAINSGSSRGPVSVDGSYRPKPDISAPGTSIRSTIPGNSYTYLTGTSMAGPHVAGVVALILSANPGLAGNVDLIEQIVQETAVPLTTAQLCGDDQPGDVPNNVYGWGRIDALAAVQRALELIPLRLDLATTTSSAQVMPGDLFTYTFTLSNPHPVSVLHNLVLTSSVPAQTSFYTATQPYTVTDDVQWQRAVLNAGDAWVVKLTVQVSPTATGSLSLDFGGWSDEVTAVTESPIITPIYRHKVYAPLVLAP